MKTRRHRLVRSRRQRPRSHRKIRSQRKKTCLKRTFRRAQHVGGGRKSRWSKKLKGGAQHFNLAVRPTKDGLGLKKDVMASNLVSNMEEVALTLKVREFLKAFLFMNEISVEAKKSKDNKFIRVYIYPNGGWSFKNNAMFVFELTEVLKLITSNVFEENIYESQSQSQLAKSILEKIIDATTSNQIVTITKEYKIDQQSLPEDLNTPKIKEEFKRNLKALVNNEKFKTQFRSILSSLPSNFHITITQINPSLLKLELIITQGRDTSFNKTIMRIQLALEDLNLLAILEKYSRQSTAATSAFAPQSAAPQRRSSAAPFQTSSALRHSVSLPIPQQSFSDEHLLTSENVDLSGNPTTRTNKLNLMAAINKVFEYLPVEYKILLFTKVVSWFQSENTASYVSNINNKLLQKNIQINNLPTFEKIMLYLSNTIPTEEIESFLTNETDNLIAQEIRIVTGLDFTNYNRF